MVMKKIAPLIYQSKPQKWTTQHIYIILKHCFDDSKGKTADIPITQIN